MLLKLLACAILIAGLFFLYIKYLESTSVFFPERNIEAIPTDIGIPFKDIYFNSSEDLKIHGWFIPYSGSKYTVLFCHGNGGNISHRLEKISILRQVKANIFILDYRGYGKSGGRPSEKGLYHDVKSAYDYLVDVAGIGPEGIILYGESLGAAAAIDLAVKSKVGGLILEGAFSNGRDMGKMIYPYIPKFFFPNIFDSLSKVKLVYAPKLFIHSRNDEIVPIVLGRKLYAESSGPKEIIEISGSHNTAFIDRKDTCILAITKFIQGL